MTYSIQGNDVKTCPTFTPSMPIQCRACNTFFHVIGTELPVEDGYSRSISYDDVESSIEQSLDKMGWEDLICNYCISNDPNIVKTYNDTEDRHEDE